MALTYDEIKKKAAKKGISASAVDSANKSLQSNTNITGNKAGFNQAISQARKSANIKPSVGPTATNIKTDTITKPVSTPQPTPKQTIPKPTTGGLGGFGDVGGRGRQQFTQQGVGLSGGLGLKDVAGTQDIGKQESFDMFGRQAELAESKTPGFLAKRNDAYIIDLVKNTPNLRDMDDATQKQKISDYLKTRDTKGELFTATGGGQDVANTIASVQARLGTTQAPQQPAEQTTPQDRATKAYERDIADVESKYKAEKDQFFRDGAVEDRYTNFNEVNENINNVMLEAGKHRSETGYTGTPTDEQIGEIAQRTGQDFNTTKQILEGRGFEALQMQGEFKEKSERGHIRQQENFETNRGRAIENADTSHLRTQTALNEQIDDVARQMERNVAIGEKAGALSGAVRSSGYMQGLTNIRDDAMRNIKRLETRKDWDTEDTATNKTRITDDFETNMTRNKQDLESAMNNIKTQNGSQLSEYLMKYAPSDEELTRKLHELDDKFAMEGQAAFSAYLGNLRGITDTLTYDTEKMLELEQKQQNLQKNNVTNLYRDNGKALSGLSLNDIGTMLQSGKISPTDYTTMVGYMKTLGVSSLQSMGVPTPTDIQQYNQFVEDGMTPQQAISQITSASPDRFSQVAEDKLRGKTQDGFQWNPQTQRYDIPVGPKDTTSYWTDGKSTNVGAKDWDKDLEVGDDVASPVSGTIKSLGTHTDGNVSMEITTEDGHMVELNHLDPSTIQKYQGMVGQKINAGDIVAVGGNTGNVKDINGNWLRRDGVVIDQGSLDRGLGSHLDVRMLDAQGNDLSGQAVKNYIEGKAKASGNKQILSDLKLIESGQVNRSDIQGIQDTAYKAGLGKEFDDSLNKGANLYITDTQRDQMNKERQTFKGNQVVKDFEEAMTQFENLQFSLSEESGPGDMAAIFQFMKTMDPSSVVRETEFEAAANSSGLGAKWSNMYEKLSRGDLLTPEMTQDFKTLTTAYIKNKATSYDRLYDDMGRVLEGFNIDNSLRPTRASEQLLKAIGGGEATIEQEEQPTQGGNIQIGEYQYTPTF